MWLGDHWLYILHRIGDIFSSTRVTVHTFKHIHPLSLVHRPKDALLVETAAVLSSSTLTATLTLGAICGTLVLSTTSLVRRFFASHTADSSGLELPNVSQIFIRDVTDDVTGRDKYKTLDFLTLLTLLGKAAISNGNKAK